MKPEDQMCLRIVKFGLMLFLGLTLCACGALNLSASTWKEEVLLHDGQVIVLERFLNLGGYPAIESHNRSPLDETITFTLPGSNKTIAWKTEYRNERPEPNSLGALLLDVVGGVPYIATSPAGCIAYNKWGRPNPPYVLFKYVNDEWQRIPLEEFPAVLVQANLMSRPDSRILEPYYSVGAAKAMRESGNRNDYAKTILREAVPPNFNNCGEMVYDGKGGWIGIGWFRKQPSRDACLKYCERENMSAQYCPCNSVFKGK